MNRATPMVRYGYEGATCGLCGHRLPRLFGSASMLERWQAHWDEEHSEEAARKAEREIRKRNLRVVK